MVTKTTQLICGIDPGLNGAVAFYNPDHDFLSVHDIPTHRLQVGKSTRQELDYFELAQIIGDKAEYIVHVFIEQVHSMPKQGVASTFSFGKVYGACVGIIAANVLPLTFVPPQVWKTSLGVKADKDAARARASQIMPKHARTWPLKKNDGRAEAALIAFYGARKVTLPKVEDLLS
jgi:crossover junction endodeoxyribonuclease RuvC